MEKIKIVDEMIFVDDKAHFPGDLWCGVIAVAGPTWEPVLQTGNWEFVLIQDSIDPRSLTKYWYCADRISKEEVMKRLA